MPGETADSLASNIAKVDKRQSGYWQSFLTAGAPYVAIWLAWLLCHPFEGVVGDGIIYLGRALADLDPNGVGRDIMFVHDGQSNFSLFRHVAHFLTAALGPGGAALTMAYVNGVVWLLSFSYLARQLVDFRLAWLPTLFVAVLPVNYGAYHVLHAGEISATPRPLAEALVFLAIAFLLRRKFGMALVSFILAAAFHPIMSLAGLAVGLIIVIRRIDRLFLVSIVLSVIVLGLALMGAPVFDRLLVLIDPKWQTLLKARHPYLYPTLWESETFSRTALSVTTLYMASLLSNGVKKRLLIAAAIVGPLGLIASMVFGDILGLLLFEQAQLWRMEWITSVLGAAALALVGMTLWTRGGLYRLSFAMLAFGWIFDNESYVALLVAPIALGLNFVAAHYEIILDRKIEKVILTIGLALLVAFKIAELSVTISTSQPDMAHILNMAKSHALSIPIVVLSFVWLQRLHFSTSSLVLSLIGASIALVFFWDAREPPALMIQTQMRDPTLTNIVDAHRGDIFWFDGFEPWYLLGRPNWASQVQGAGGVFSRELSTIFAARIQAGVDAGLLPLNAAHPFEPLATYNIPTITKAGVARICARSDAPAWIVMPLTDDARSPPDVATHIWHAPYQKYAAHLAKGVLTWRPVTAYIMAACAEQDAKGS